MKNRNKLIIVIAFCLTAGLAVLSGMASIKEPMLTCYTVSSPKLDSSFRLVLLADLHNSEFGEQNDELVSLVAQQKPDIILTVGDMVNGDEERLDIAQMLLQRLSEIAPVYASYGNHEIMHEENFGSDLEAVFEQAGAHVLDFEYEDVSIGNQTIRIGGQIILPVIGGVYEPDQGAVPWTGARRV